VHPEGHVALLNNKRIRKLREKGGNIKKNGNIRKKQNDQLRKEYCL
jgi:hypothetical protein